MKDRAPILDTIDKRNFQNDLKKTVVKRSRVHFMTLEEEAAMKNAEAEGATGNLEPMEQVPDNNNAGGTPIELVDPTLDVSDVDPDVLAQADEIFRRLQREAEEDDLAKKREWEDKIKGALLRRDMTLNDISSAVKKVMLEGVSMDDGTSMYLTNFGIETLSYFTAKDNEKNAYHIAGDPDDSAVKAEADKLKALIASEPEKVTEFFSKLAQNLYTTLHDKMESTDYSSAFTVYDDKQMKKEYEAYKKKIDEEQEKVNKYIDNWYSKFSAMETALAKMQSKSSAITGMLGGNS